MKVRDFIARAQSAVGHGTVYKLGKGGFNPANPVPWSSLGECDCSGFVAWCLGLSRHTDNPWYVNQNGGWIETTAIVRDAETPFGFFQLVSGSPWNSGPVQPVPVQVRPGTILVWGDANGRQGHVGILAEMSSDQTTPGAVIHCSAGNFRKGGDAIQQTGADIFKRNKAICVRSAFVEFA